MGKIGPFVGLDYEIGPFVGIGPVVGIGLFGGTGPVVSLTNMRGFKSASLSKKSYAQVDLVFKTTCTSSTNWLYVK